MPRQECYFDTRNESKRVQVLKVYDGLYARTCFEEMHTDALRFLAKSMDLGSKYDMTEDEVTWEDVEEEAREDGNLLSFFVVIEESNDLTVPLYLSPDWPSAEEFAKGRLSLEKITT